jgi:hypothetical protein
MTRRATQSTTSVLLAVLAALFAALPATSVCSDADCCPEAADEGVCPGCEVIGCDEGDPGFAVVGPGLVLQQPAGAVAVLLPESRARRAPPPPGASPSVCPCLATTVLLI